MLSERIVCATSLEKWFQKERERKRKSLQEGIGHPRDVALLSCSFEVLSKGGVCKQN